MHPGSEPLENEKYELFAREYLVDRSGGAAAIRAGYAKKSAYVTAHRLITDHKVKARIDFLTSERLAKTDMSAEEVIERIVAIARADPNELIQNRIGPCRHCHGIDGAYQWRNEREYRAACAAWDNQTAKYRKAHPDDAPDDSGGFGYRRTLPVNPDCDECDGLGEHYVAPRDTTQLSPLGRALYAGVKQTKDGIEIKMQDQMKALTMLAEITKATRSTAAAIDAVADAITQVNKMQSSAPVRTIVDDEKPKETGE